MYISINWIKDFVDLDGIDVENLIYKFTMSTDPVPGAIFSAMNPSPWGHVGFVKAVNGNEITIQEGNLDGITNVWEDAIRDWQEVTYTLPTIRSIYAGLTFANPTGALANSTNSKK